MIDPRWLFIVLFIIAQPAILGMGYVGEPLMTGEARWYSAPGQIMRDGNLFDATAMTCAVDDSRWSDLEHTTLLVCSETRCVFCRVTDTGYLDGSMDLTHGGFNELREIGSPSDNDGRLEVTAWRVQDGIRN